MSTTQDTRLCTGYSTKEEIEEAIDSFFCRAP